jgi:ferredoxin-NADP reductase/nitrite reductase/ring-hydroxylating ferredoxin subunit
MGTKMNINCWYPIASSTDIGFRHVFHTELFGQEIAVWRDDNGLLNAWENQCPHRGLRLTLGVNLGDSLRCQYHGWTYQSATGFCASVPAQRSSPPPAAARVDSFVARESQGLVWLTLGEPVNDPPCYDEGNERQACVGLRPTLFQSDVVTVARFFQCMGGRFAELFGTTPEELEVRRVNDITLEVRPAESNEFVRWVMQPKSAERTTVHARWVGQTSVSMQVHRNFTALMNELGRSLVHSMKALPGKHTTASRVCSEAFELGADVRSLPAMLRYDCEVVARNQETSEIVSFHLKPINRVMPPLAPGMHANVTTPAGVVRQYSIVNAPNEEDVFVIGVKREPASRGGSESMHEKAFEGTRLKVQVPRNGFPLIHTQRKPILIAGGIGITPLLSMAQTLIANNRNFELHYFVRSAEHAPFRQRLKGLGRLVCMYESFGIEAVRQTIQRIIESHPLEGIDLYVCGPGPMIEEVREIARRNNVDEQAVHYEYFKNDLQVHEGQAFEVYLERTGKRFNVPSGKTLLEACLDEGVRIESSCQQGVCGTCLTKVISGELEHRDLYLSPQEKAAGQWLMPCVSRAKTGVLVLDL